MAAAVTIKVSGLNPGASGDRVKGFFEDKGEDISVGSCIFHDDGTALVELIGVTQEELDELLGGSYKLLKCPIQLEVVPPDVRSSECKRSSVSSLIEVRGAVGLDQEELELYFETPRAGGRKGSVKSCVIDQDGVARIEFDSPEVVEEIMSITKHSVLGVPLKVTYPSSPDQQAGSRPSKIWLTEMPSVLMNDTEYLAALLGRTIGHELVFSLTQVDSTTLVLEFSEEVHLSEKELMQIVEKLGKKQVKGTPLKPTLALVPPVTKAMPKKKWKLLVSTSEQIDPEHLLLLLENATSMENDQDFSVSFVGSRDCVVTLEQNLSDEEVECFIHMIEPKLRKKQIGVKVIDCCQLLLSELPSIEMAHLELQIAKVIGKEKEFVLKESKNKTAVLEFKRSIPDADLDAVVAVIAKTKVKGANIKVQKLELPYVETPPSTSSPCRLLLSGVPSVDIEYLGLLIEKATQLEYGTDFILEEQDENLTLMTLKKQLSEKERDSLLTTLAKVEVKGAVLKVEVLKGEVTDNVPSVLHVSNMPPNLELDYLGLHLEKLLKMELEEDFTLATHDDTSALVRFKKCLSPQELEKAIERITKTALKGKTLKAAVFSLKQAKTSSGDPSSLLLQDMPNGVDEEYLGIVLSKAMKIDENEFSIKYLGSGAALLTFKQCLCDVALQDRIRKIEMKPLKGMAIKAVCWKTTPCIFIRNITEHYDEDFLTNYFENTIRSGGGEVASVELFGNGEAKVMFKDLKVMQNVIQKPHKVLGDVTVTQDNPLEKFSDSNHAEPALQTISIKVSPLIVEVLHGEEANLNRLLNNLHVSVNVDKDQAAIKIVPSKHTPAGWMKCETNVKVYIENNFATKDLPVSKDAVLDIVKALQQRKKELQYNFSDDNTHLQLVGHPNLLIQIQNQVSEIVANVTIIDKEITMNPEDYEFLLQTKQPDITLTFPYVKMTFIPPRNIKVNGAAKDVKKFEESVLRLSAHSSVTMVLDPLLTDFVCTKDGREQTKNYISSLHGISVAMCIKESGNNCTVLVLCDPQIIEKMTKAVSDVQKELRFDKLTISSKCQAKLSELNTSKEYNELCEQLQKKHGAIVKITKDSISVAGFKDKVSQTISGFKEFIDTKCKVTSPLILEDGEWRLLQGHMKSEWDSLVKCAKDVEVVLRSDIKNTCTTINIHGQVDSVDRMYNVLVALQQKILKKNIYPPSCVIGFQEHAKSNEWKTFVPGIESVHKVCISVLNSADVTKSDLVIAKEVEIEGCDNSVAPIEGNENGIMSPPQSMWNCLNLKCVKIHKGSLLDVKAEVYVNSTNNSLDLSGGAISKMFVEAAGPTLQEECSRKAPIVSGQIAVTGSGNIKCKHIFHLALNNYDGPGGNAEKILKESMEKCLDECRQQKISSIAFPALGTGVLHFPPQVAAKIMMESVATMKDSTGLTVHIVIFMDAVHKAFEEMKGILEQSISSPFGTETKQAYQLQNSLSTSYHKNSSRKLHTSPLQSTRLSDNKFNINGVTVEIVQGDITDQTCDVIVSSTSSDMKNTSGVSGAILKKGGPELIKSCEAYISKNKQLDVGKVVATPASGGLKCKTVFHINVNPALLESAVTECLKEADRQKYQSISFPALATGNHKSSADKVASEMLKAIQQYALQNTQHATSISIVVFQLDLLLPFLKALQSFSSALLPDIGTQGQHMSNTIDTVTRDNTVSPFVFRIFGNHDHGTKTAAELLMEHLNKNFICEIVSVESTEFKPSPEVIKLCSDNCVTLNHDPTQNTIILTGQKAWVDAISKKIVKDSIQITKMASFKREAELLQKQVEWQHQMSDKSYVAYSPEINFRIEEAFKAKQLKYDHDDPSDSFCIDFKTNTETKTKPNSSAILVRREDLLARYIGETPKTWDIMPIDPQTQKRTMCQLFTLKNTSQEYIDVLQKFASTVTAKKIVSIQRVQNTVLYGQYSARKKAMENIFPPGTKYENLLFHGTSADTCHKINSQGFNRSFAGVNATFYGKGVYFAVNASYSAQPTYSPPDPSGHKYMYLVRVLIGEFTAGSKDVIVPPPKNIAKDPNVLFDSLVDNVANPSMYVIFQDAQAYPEYLITFVV